MSDRYIPEGSVYFTVSPDNTFSDEDGTVPAKDGDEVLSWRDSSGALVKNPLSTAPKLKFDETRSMYCLEFEGL